jgi:transcriptional regulator with PAS, ATPase and Fis domain
MADQKQVSRPSSSAVRVYDLKAMAKKAAETAEREHIKNTLIYTNWNRKAAAKLLQISYKALLYKIEKYGLTHLTPIEDLRTKE